MSLPKHPFIVGKYTSPEFEYLSNNKWMLDEKIDGTNIRIGWDGCKIRIGGRTDNAQIPTFLYDKLTELFNYVNMERTFLNLSEDGVCLFGEGYGAKIQKGGVNYIKEGVGFILFDVKVGHYWLLPDDIKDVAQKLNIDHVPSYGTGTINEAIEMVKGGLISHFGDFKAEGLVLRPQTPLYSRRGHRIITKIKGKDFK